VVGLWDEEVRLPWLKLFQTGFIGAISVNDYSMSTAIWFHCFGLALLMLGYLASRYRLDTQRPPPAAFGCALAVLGLFGGLAKPSSGFWLVLLNAVWILVLDYTWKPQVPLPSSSPRKSAKRK